MTNGAPPDGAPLGGGPAQPPPQTGGSGVVAGLKVFAIIAGVLTWIMLFFMTLGRLPSNEEAFVGLSEDMVVNIGLVMGIVGLVFGSLGIFIGKSFI